MDDEQKFIRDVKLFIALWENTPTNIKRFNVTECLENGADVNIKFLNNANNTPLHVAIAKGDRDIVNILLSYGAKANIPNDAGKTALQLAKELPECSDITDILIAHEEMRVKDKEDTILNKNINATKKYEYKKRPGTANIRGQLYETKLLTTIFLRALRCKEILQFYLGTNVDETGGLDDVCMRLKARSKDYVIFLQAKYRHDIMKGSVGDEDLWKLSGDFSLLKYFDSYLRIREKFHLDSDDELFRGKYLDIKPFFVIYTTIRDRLNKNYKKLVPDEMVHELLETGEHKNIFQFICEEQYIEALTNVKLIERVKNMGKKFMKLIQDNKYESMMCDESIRVFHVILAQQVINVTDVNSEGHRIGTFREEFFSSNKQLLVVLRDTLYAEIVKHHKLSTEQIEDSIHKISIEPTADTICDLIGNVLVYDSNTSTLEITEEAFENNFSYQHILKSVQVAQSEINEAIQIAGRRKLKKLVFKLPVTFGNLDMTINKKKIERRLEYLAEKICDVVKKTADEEGNVVIREGVFTSDKRLEAGILGINGGIAGAIGNLLVVDDKNKLKFNLNIDSLGENAKKLLLKLRERLKNINKYRFCVEIEDFPRYSLQATEYEKRFARDFFKNLYFYTCQAKEENLEEIATKELQTHEGSSCFSKSESRIKSNALFLKIHNEIQIWWMMEQSVYYLTRNMENFEKIFSYLNYKGLLTFLNILYLKDVYSNGLEFRTDALDVLSICKEDIHDREVTIIHSEAHILTSHKMAQYFKNMDNYTFVDIDYICKVSPNYSETIFAEIREIDVPIVIIVCEDVYKYTNSIEDIIHGCVNKKLILVTNTYSKKYEGLIVKDDRINLSYLTHASQRKVLESSLTFQGIEVTYADVYYGAKQLISPKILQKIIKNEKITLGQTLESLTYEDMKYYYVPRVLERNSIPCISSIGSAMDLMVSSFDDDDQNLFSAQKRFSPTNLINHYDTFETTRIRENPDVVLIIDAPGMGKSTLLTHLSLETKRHFPYIWIQRINLINHTKQFHEWQVNNIEINDIEILKFLCKVVLSKDTLRGKIYNLDTEILFKIVNDEVRLDNCDEYCPLKLLELNTFLNCFNKRNIIFLFDGFDEISPHYKNEVITLLKFLIPRHKVNDSPEESRAQFRIWMTSRPYNDLKNTLEAEFGESYTLLPFSYYDTYVFVDKYLRRNLNLKTLTQEQLKNIDGFFEYMKIFDLRGRKQAIDSLNVTNVQLHGIYMAVAEYFKNEIKQTCLADTSAYVKHWDFQEDVLLVWKLFKDEIDYTKATTLSGLPLNVYIAVVYLLSQIKDNSLVDTEQRIQQWNLDTNTFTFYERFLETKLKTIRFEEKNSMDIYNPDVQITYEREMKDFRDKHMKLGFYTIFEKNLLTDGEYEEVIAIMKDMKIGQDKTGLVDKIVNGKATFVHYTFAEYFAVEYIIEIMKTGEVDKQVKILDFILNDMTVYINDGFQRMLDLKLKCTPGLVSEVNSTFVKQHIFRILVEQIRDIDKRKSHTLCYSTVLDIIVENDLMYLAKFLIEAVLGAVDETNINDFLLIVKNGTFFQCLVNKSHKKLIDKIMECIISVDAIKCYIIIESLWMECHPPFLI